MSYDSRSRLNNINLVLNAWDLNSPKHGIRGFLVVKDVNKIRASDVIIKVLIARA